MSLCFSQDIFVFKYCLFDPIGLIGAGGCYGARAVNIVALKAPKAPEKLLRNAY